MANRAYDWFNQALRDLEQAEDSRSAGGATNGHALRLSNLLRRQ